MLSSAATSDCQEHREIIIFFIPQTGNKHLLLVGIELDSKISLFELDSTFVLFGIL